MSSFLARAIIFLGAAVTAVFPASAQNPAFTHFEARQTHAIGLTPNGARLLALNSVGGSLSVFDATTAIPSLIAEIPVGLEPVSVRALTDDEVWVVNEVGDSVSIVSLSKKSVVATLPASDEPGDIVFAQGKAFVSCARNRLVRVFDTATRQALTTIPLEGLDPRALAVNAAGTKVYAVFLQSGNQTTILPRGEAPPQPTPDNPNIAEGPNVALIVPADDSRIPYTVLDRDVAVIDVATSAVTYFGGTGTSLFDVAVNPASGDLFIANTEARNLVRFEPALKSHIVENRLTRLALDTGVVSSFDLNPGIDYTTLPNPAALATSLAQPTGLAFTPDGSGLWVAAFGSDRVALFSPSTGSVVTRIDLRPSGATSAEMRGPRALALHPASQRLFVLNKLSDTVAVISTETAAVTAELALSPKDHMPALHRAGRGFLFDARLSGNGTTSCASCHLDADRDGLAWDLGDPAGNMQTVIGTNNSVHDPAPRERMLHPMKGPMVTQTLRGLQGGAPFHWRGDRPQIQSFNPAFASLLGGTPIPGADMDALAAYLLSLRNHPNPNRTRINTLPDTFAGGNPVRGQTLFNTHTIGHCALCHGGTSGSDGNLDLMTEVGSSQPLKNPPLATTYQRANFDPRSGAQTLTGFGMLHDGTGSVLPTVHPYVLDTLSTQADFLDVQAFVLCFDSGTATGVGEGFTLTSAMVRAASTAADLTRVETFTANTGDLVVFGAVKGVQRRYYFSRELQLYIPDDFHAPPLTRAKLLATLAAGDALTFSIVPPAQGARLAGMLDRATAPASDSFFTRSRTVAFRVPAARGVLANDVGLAPGRDAVAPGQATVKGTITLARDGSFLYVPGPDFRTDDLDVFTYRALLAANTANASAPVTATVSTYATAAGRYAGNLQLSDGTTLGGFANVNVTATGAFSAQVILGTTRAVLAGVVLPDGLLRPNGRPPVTATLRLQALPNGKRQLVVALDRATAHAAGILERGPFTATALVPNSGRHILTLTPGVTTGTGPTATVKVALTLGRTGTAALAGRLGDGTAFSCAGGLTAGAAGGWRFMAYTTAYAAPAGTITGELTYDPAGSAGITGALLVKKPPQTRRGPYHSGFTIEYGLTE